MSTTKAIDFLMDNYDVGFVEDLIAYIRKGWTNRNITFLFGLDHYLYNMVLDKLRVEISKDETFTSLPTISR